MVILLNEKMWPFQSQLNVRTLLTAAVVEMFVRVLTRVGKAEKSQQIFGWPFLRS